LSFFIIKIIYNSKKAINKMKYKILLMEVLKNLKFKPTIIKDKLGNFILIREYNHDKDRDNLIKMYLTFDPSCRCLGLPPSTKEELERWIDYLAKEGFSIVAEQDGKIIGHLAIVPDKKGQVVDMSIFVHQDYQNRKIGQQMISLIIEYCKMVGYKGIYAITCKDNLRAVHVYKKLGFKIIDDSYEYDMYLDLTSQKMAECKSSS